MSQRPWQDEETLRELFFDEGLSQYEMADRLGCQQVTIAKWFNKHGIETDFETYDELRDEEWLREMYYEHELSQHEIADEIGCCQMTVSRWMRKHGLETRKANYEKYGSHEFTEDGYSRFTHQYDGSRWSVLIHRLVAVAEYGFDAVKDKDIHHINGLPWDNRHENLKPMDHAEHISLHRSQ